MLGLMPSYFFYLSFLMRQSIAEMVSKVIGIKSFYLVNNLFKITLAASVITVPGPKIKAVPAARRKS